MATYQQSITSRSGIVQTMSYGTGGLLSGVSDNFGNTLTLGRNSSGQVASITVNGGAAIQYSYDSQSRLVTVTYPDSTTLNYAYGDSNFTNALKGDIDESGVQFSAWSYDGQERAISTQEAGNAGATSLTYNPDVGMRCTWRGGYHASDNTHFLYSLSMPGALRPEAEFPTESTSHAACH